MYCKKCMKTLSENFTIPQGAIRVDALRRGCEDHSDDPFVSMKDLTGRETRVLSEIIGSHLKVLAKGIALGLMISHRELLHMRCTDDRVVTLITESPTQIYLEWEPCPENIEIRHHRMHVFDWISYQNETLGVVDSQ